MRRAVRTLWLAFSRHAHHYPTQGSQLRWPLFCVLDITRTKAEHTERSTHSRRTLKHRSSVPFRVALTLLIEVRLQPDRAIQAATGEGFEYHLQATALKYLWRYRYKGKPLEDLKKARWYLDRLIEEHDPEPR